MSESIFKKDSNGDLIFVGDFESYYCKVDDPWDQSNTSQTEMTEYYRQSRINLLNEIKSLCESQHTTLSEVGCGLGYILRDIYNNIRVKNLYGIDISGTAIERARVLHKEEAEFFVHDIASGPLPKKTNIIILSNLLWYILENIKEVLKFSIDSLQPLETGEMHFILHNAFFKDGQQKYGVDIVSSLHDVIYYLTCAIKMCDHIKLTSLNTRIISIPNSKYDELFILATFTPRNDQ